MLEIPTSGALHPDDVASLTEKWIAAFESDEAMVLTYRMRRKDGSYVWVESISRARCRSPGAGSPERILVVRDIDRRVAAEQKIEGQRSALSPAGGICDRHGVSTRLRSCSLLCLAGLP